MWFYVKNIYSKIIFTKLVINICIQLWKSIFHFKLLYTPAELPTPTKKSVNYEFDTVTTAIRLMIRILRICLRLSHTSKFCQSCSIAVICNNIRKILTFLFIVCHDRSHETTPNLARICIGAPDWFKIGSCNSSQSQGLFLGGLAALPKWSLMTCNF